MHRTIAYVLGLWISCLVIGIIAADEEIEDSKEAPGFLDTSDEHVSALLEQELGEWVTWRDRSIHYLLSPFDGEEGPCLEIDGVAARAAVITEVFDRCREMNPTCFDRPSALHDVLKNLVRFTRAVGLQDNPDHVSGFTTTDVDYYDLNRAEIEFPELLRSQEFLQAVSDPATYRDAYEMIERANGDRPDDEQWISFLYKSRFLKTPDELTYGRFFVYVPGDPSKWIQYGIVTPDMVETQIHSVSIVSVDAGHPMTANRTSRIVDYWRVYKTNEIELITKIEAGEGGANCFNCHKTAVLPIRPAEEYRFGEEGELLLREEGAGDIPEKLNKLMSAYGAPYFGGYMDTLAYGPSLGQADRERTDSFLHGVADSLGITNVSFDAIRQNMNCAACHHPSLMGRLNYPQAVKSDQDYVDLVDPDTGDPAPLIETYIRQGWMPPWNELSDDERRVLHAALMKEYFDVERSTGLLVDWLRNVSAH